MPSKPPRICGCGHAIAAGTRCACQRKRDAARKAAFDRRRPNSSTRGYSGNWDRARAQFLEANPRCRRCGAAADVVDHTVPHRGDPDLFWDKANWQPLCTSCHSSAKQREERRLIERT